MTNDKEIQNELINFKNSQIKGFGQGLLLILIIMVISIPVNFFTHSLTKLFANQTVWVTFLNFVLSMGISLFVAMRIWDSKTFAHKKTSLLVYFIILPATLAIGVITESIASLIPMPEEFSKIFEQMITFDLAGFLTVAIAAPILEELIFRGIVLKTFLKKYNPLKAILLSALLFGIVHFNPWQFIAAFAMGIAIGWVYYQTKSIFPAIFIHFVNNCSGFILGKKYGDINLSTYELVGSTANYILLMVGSILIIILSYYAFTKMITKAKQENN